MGYKLVVLPNFHKKETELEGYMDQWLYFLKNLSEMEEISKFLDKRIFSRIFEVGEIAKLNKEELMAYQASIKQKMDAESIFSSARRAGRQEGHREGHKEGHKEGQQEAKKAFVRNLILKTNMDNEQIADVAIVSLAFVQKVRREISKEDLSRQIH